MKSKIGFRARLRNYRLIPKERRDIFHLIELLTGWY